MGAYSNWLKKQALSSVTQPLSSKVDSNEESYLDAEGFEKLGWRHFRRRVQFGLSGQQKYLRNEIDPSWKKALWVYKGIPQIGDTLMDLAPRSLLSQRGLHVDLYTDSHLAAMFTDDPWLGQVYDDPREVAAQNYDFVIVPSHKNRSLHHKTQLLPHLSWVSMHCFYTGPEFHRGKFGAQRIIDLLGDKTAELEFALHQQQKLRPLIKPANDGRGHSKIAIALGGVDAARTYNHWLALAEKLFQSDNKIELTLVGSSNAIEIGQMFVSQFSKRQRIVNLVNKTNITECRNLINQQDLLIAADGGLMHLGATTSTKLISLFHKKVDPQWRLSGTHLQSCLQSSTLAVSDIAVDAIVKTCLSVLVQP